MNKFLLAGVGIVAFGITGMAGAADLPQAPIHRAAIEAPYNWIGLYAGINGGAGRSNDNGVSFSPANTDTAIFFPGVVPGNVSGQANGVLAGGQIGYNWQTRANWIFGVEADFDWANIKGSGSASTTVAFFDPFTTAAQTKLDSFSSLRARAGYAWDRFLVYGTGGAAFGKAELQTSVLDTRDCGPGGVCAANATSKWLVGWTIGGGAELGLTSNLSAKVEYLYYDLGSVSHTAVDPRDTPPGVPVFGSSANYRGSVVRVGLNYKLGALQ
ncbi:MAG TPA: outer membrane beta-barrel protein [Pseudolabrys sp.]